MIKGRLVFPLLSPENWGERKKEKEEKSFGRSEHTHTHNSPAKHFPTGESQNLSISVSGLQRISQSDYLDALKL